MNIHQTNSRHLSLLNPLIISAFCVLGFQIASFGSNFTIPKGSERATKYSDLKDHPLSGRTYNEFWTYQFHFEQSIQMVLNFSRANLGPLKDPVCGVDMGLIGFKGKNYALAREYPKSNFKFSDLKQKLNVHKKIWFAGKLPEAHRVYLNTRKNDISYLIDLSFSEIEPGKTLGDGVFHSGDEKIGIYIHIPRAKVSGVIAINNDTITVTGIGYMDHTFQSQMGTKLVHSGFRYQSLGNEIHAAYLLTPLEGTSGEIFGLGVKGQPGSLSLLIPTQIKTESKTKRKGITLPKEMTVYYQNAKARFKRGNDAQQWSVFSELGKFLRWSAKKMMGGEIVYFRGKGSIDNQPAVYNIFGVKK